MVCWLQQVCDEIARTEGNIRDLKKAIKDKENPMKVAQTRLHTREYRPNVELCRDPVQYKSVHLIAQLAHKQRVWRIYCVCAHHGCNAHHVRRLSWLLMPDRKSVTWH